MIFKVAVLQMRSENRAYEENIKTIIKYMTEAKKNNADILLLETTYAEESSLDTRLNESRKVRSQLPDCKIVFLCDENSAPDIARSICNAKKDGIIDAFFYTSVSSTYLLDALDAL